jgi:hypothetical protein
MISATLSRNGLAKLLTNVTKSSLTLLKSTVGLGSPAKGLSAKIEGLNDRDIPVMLAGLKLLNQAYLALIQM